MAGCGGGAREVSSAPEALVRHPVTTQMWQTAKTLESVAAPAFRLKDASGKEYDFASLSKGRPVVLYFIKDGCPCSIDVEPLLQKMAKSYGDAVQFVGVLNGGPEVAAKWQTVARTPYPVLLDPEVKTMRAFKAERSTYTALIKPDGTIVRLWPGYSADMLKELNAAVAKQANVDAKPYDPAYAPQRITSGCSFYTPDPKA